MIAQVKCSTVVKQSKQQSRGSSSVRCALVQNTHFLLTLIARFLQRYEYFYVNLLIILNNVLAIKNIETPFEQIAWKT